MDVVRLKYGEIHQGNARKVLKTFPAESVNCCVTSPPYWKQRDYQADGQLGHEKTPEEYIDNMLKVCRQIHRVLRDDGTFWLNIGDKYQGKQLLGIPWRLALALQAEGWYLRQDVIWHKPSPIPNSQKDRCTTAHEYVFMLSKSSDYYFDGEAIKERCKSPGKIIRADKTGWAVQERDGASMNNKEHKVERRAWKYPDLAMKRSVWTVNKSNYGGKHFATFPAKLIEPCILAGCPENGVVLDPFFGAGTTGVVAQHHRRRFIGVELNEDYVEIAAKRIKGSFKQTLWDCVEDVSK